MNYITTNEAPSAERSEVGAATRAALIDAARAAFAQNGFDGTSVRAITSAAGANLGAISYHFGSKRALYDVVLEQGLRPLLARVQKAVSSEGSALDRMTAVVGAYFEHLSIHPDLPHLLLQEIAAGRQPPAMVLEIVREVKDSIARLQIEGEADGSVRSGHPTLTALSVVAQPIYLTLVAPILQTVAQVDLTDDATRRVAVEHATEFVRRGLSPQSEAHL